MLLSIVTMQISRMDTLRPVKGILPNNMIIRGTAGASMAQGIRVLERRSAGSNICF
jgi:hypothetical protein